MPDLYIDPDTGDLGFYNNSIRLTQSNAELTRQRIETTLKTYRGEWVFDINEGIPYLENANNQIQLIGKGAIEDFDSYIKQAILNKPFVDSIEEYSSSLDGRTNKLSISCRIKGSDGEVTDVNVSL